MEDLSLHSRLFTAVGFAKWTQHYTHTRVEESTPPPIIKILRNTHVPYSLGSLLLETMGCQGGS